MKFSPKAHVAGRNLLPRPDEARWFTDASAGEVRFRTSLPVLF